MKATSSQEDIVTTSNDVSDIDTETETSTHTGTTSTSATSLASSNRGTVYYVGRFRSLLFEICLFATKHSYSRFALPLFILQAVQILSFTVEPLNYGYGLNNAFSSSSSISISSSSSESYVSYGMQLFNEIVVGLRTFLPPNPSPFVVSSLMYFYLSLAIALVLLIAALYYRSNINFHVEGKIAITTRLVIEIWSTVLYLPVIHCSLLVVMSSEPWLIGHFSATTRILAAILFVLCNLLTVMSTLFQYEFVLDSKHIFARFLSRVESLHWLLSTVLSIWYHCSLFDPLSRFELLRPITLYTIMAMVSLIEVLVIGWTAPYYRWWVNHLKMGTYSTLLFSAVIGGVIAAYPSRASVCLILLWASVLPLATLGFFASKMWFAVVTHKLRCKLVAAFTTAKRDLDVQSHCNTGFTFWEIRITILHLFSHFIGFFDEDSTLLDRITEILPDARTNTKHVAETEVLYSLLKLVNSEEPQVAIHLWSSQQHKPAWDIQLLIHRMEEYRKVGCKEADKYTKKATDLRCKFWQLLLTDSVEELQNTLSKFDQACHRTITIFERLQAKYPKATTVLRHYGHFLEQIRNDYEVASSMYARADFIEEMQGKSHHNKGTKQPPRFKKKNSVAPIDFDLEDTQNYEVTAKKKEMLDPGYEGHHRKTTVAFTTSLNSAMHSQAQLPELSVRHEEPRTLEQSKADEMLEGEAANLNSGVNSKQWQVYKEKILKLRSSVYWQLMISTIIIVAVVIFNVTLAFICVRRGLKIQRQSYYLMFEVIENSYIPAGTFNTEDMINHLRHGQNMSFTTAGERLRTVASTLDGLVNTLYSDASSNAMVPFSIWTEQKHNVSFWNEYTFSRTFMLVSLREMLSDFKRNLLSTSQISPNSIDDSSFVVLPDVRYILDNGKLVIREALDNLVQAYHDISSHESKKSITILAVLLPITTLIVLLSGFLLFGRAMVLLRKEREALIHMFLSIPRHAVLEIYYQCGGSQASICRLRITTLQLTQYSWFVKFRGSKRIALGAFDKPLAFTQLRLLESTPLRRCTVLTIALLNRDTLCYGSIQDIRSLLQENVNLFEDAQSEANKISGSLSLDLQSDDMEILLEHKECNLTDAGYCSGLNDLIYKFLSSVNLLQVTDEAFISQQNKDYRVVHNLAEPLFSWLAQFDEKLVDYWVQVLAREGLVVAIIFGLFWPTTVMVLPLLFSSKKKKSQANVIDEASELKQFIENGKIVNYRQRIAKMLAQSQQKTKQILEAAADAIVVFNTGTMLIEIFNTSAQKMFGYTADEVVGSPVNILLDEAINQAAEKSRESTAVHKDGSKFPILLSKSNSSSEGFSALFIRDVREIRTYRNLIERNEALLLKMLPKNIALRLKDCLSSQQSYGEALIADSHESVSILFADIVKFSQWSTSIDAQQLVSLLNKLVCAWDALAVRCGVEKIKTIGDCYMAACGCPDPNEYHAVTIVSFAERMIRTLKLFNEQNGTDLQIRIGVNSGPVVAGVIGLSKVVYDIWGPCVNLASRMESFGFPNTIQVTENTYKLLGDKFPFEARGEIEVKGGFKVTAYLYSPDAPLKQSSNKVVTSITNVGISLRSSAKQPVSLTQSTSSTTAKKKPKSTHRTASDSLSANANNGDNDESWEQQALDNAVDESISSLQRAVSLGESQQRTHSHDKCKDKDR
ncbi:family 3 adenylate cyclase [Pelomyxa schiedti]|nr:family 3 adenylate cyclase [Pelomyxa schiedti]